MIGSIMMRRGGLMASRRWLSSSSSAVTTTTPSTATATAAPKKKGGLKQSLTWFMVGLTLSGGLGYYQLSNDVETCVKDVENALAELRRDTLESQKALRNKVRELEGN